jgi:hypothetical protein
LALRIEEIVAGIAVTRLAGRIGEVRRQAASDMTSE